VQRGPFTPAFVTATGDDRQRGVASERRIHFGQTTQHERGAFRRAHDLYVRACLAKARIGGRHNHSVAALDDCATLSHYRDARSTASMIQLSPIFRSVKAHRLASTRAALLPTRGT